MPPEASVQDNWIEKSDMRVSNKDVKADWWRVFNDPTLDRLIHLGADENLPVQIAGLRILGARAQLGVAIGELFPQQQEAAGIVQPDVWKFRVCVLTHLGIPT